MGMGIDLYVPSLPAITHYFHAPRQVVQLSISLYMLGYGVGQLFLGVLSDVFGRRKLLLYSAFFYTVVSFLAALSPNEYVLNLCRLLQGLGVAGLGSVRRAIIVDCFSGFELDKVMTYMSISWAIGPIIGPFIGGYLQHYFNWRAAFYFFGLYGFIIWIYTCVVQPETNLYMKPFRVSDFVSSLKMLLTHPAFVFSMVILGITYSNLVIFNVVGPFLIQNVLHYSVVAYGKIALILGLGYFSGNFLNRILIQFINPLRIVLVGLLGTILISAIMLFLGIWVPINLLIILLPVIVLNALCGLVFPNLTSLCLGIFPKIAGTASAVFGAVVALCVFMMSSFAALLKTSSQMPLALMYGGLAVVCLVLFVLMRRLSFLPMHR